MCIIIIIFIIIIIIIIKAYSSGAMLCGQGICTALCQDKHLSEVEIPSMTLGKKEMLTVTFA